MGFETTTTGLSQALLKSVRLSYSLGHLTLAWGWNTLFGYVWVGKGSV